MCLLCIVAVGHAKKKDKVELAAMPASIHNYPTGAVDEFHFRRGSITVKGSLANVPLDEYGTISLTGYDIFTDESFVETIKVDEEGNFMSTFTIPHSQYIYVEYFDYHPFVAVGDTLTIHIDSENATFDGTGVTGEVNRVWPCLERQFFAGQEDEKPWEEKNREVMLDWRKRKLDNFSSVVHAIDADTISILEGCSDFAKDVLKSNLLARIPDDIGVGFHQYGWRVKDEQHRTPPELVIAKKEIWDFLPQCEQYILNNPLMLFTRYGSGMINKLEYGPLDGYIYLANRIDQSVRGNEPEYIEEYKELFILPAAYNSQEHQQILASRDGGLLTIADYYQMAADSIRSRFNLTSNNFLMQVCLLHYALNVEFEIKDEWFMRTMAERFAGAIPQFENKLVAYRAVEKYRKFVIEKEGRMPEVSLSPEGDALFDALLEKYKGNVIYMDFWGMSCGPCRADMLDSREDVEYFKDKPVKYLYICNEKDSPREASEEFMNKNNIQGEHIFLTFDEWNYLAKKFQFNATPYRLLIDRNGDIVVRNTGVTRKMIDNLVK